MGFPEPAEHRDGEVLLCTGFSVLTVLGEECQGPE
jgi:hypothetical protein